MQQSVLVFRFENHVLFASRIEVHALVVESEELLQLVFLPNGVSSKQEVIMEFAPVLSCVTGSLPLVSKSYPSGILAHSGYGVLEKRGSTVLAITFDTDCSSAMNLRYGLLIISACPLIDSYGFVN